MKEADFHLRGRWYAGLAFVVTVAVMLLWSPPASAQDADGDGDVDLFDFMSFQACYNGPNRPYAWPGPECPVVDEDADLDVDIKDYAAFVLCFNGPSRPPRCPVSPQDTVTWMLRNTTPGGAGPYPVGHPQVDWEAAVRYSGAGSGVATLIFSIEVADETATLIPVQLPLGESARVFDVDGNATANQLPPAKIVEWYDEGGPRMWGWIPESEEGSHSTLYSAILGRLDVLGAMYDVSWVYTPEAQRESWGIGMDSRKDVLLADPDGDYVVRVGSIPTDTLPPGIYTVTLIPEATHVLSLPPGAYDVNLYNALAAPAETVIGDSFQFVIGEVTRDADFDDDGDVDGCDFLRFKAAFYAGYDADPEPDLDGDADIDISDLQEFVSQYTGPGNLGGDCYSPIPALGSVSLDLVLPGGGTHTVVSPGAHVSYEIWAQVFGGGTGLDGVVFDIATTTTRTQDPAGVQSPWPQGQYVSGGIPIGDDLAGASVFQQLYGGAGGFGVGSPVQLAVAQLSILELPKSIGTYYATTDAGGAAVLLYGATFPAALTHGGGVRVDAVIDCDYDDDGDVDLSDFGLFLPCFNGAGRAPTSSCPPEIDADYDDDEDVDLEDFAGFMVCYNGPNRPMRNDIPSWAEPGQYYCTGNVPLGGWPE